MPPSPRHATYRSVRSPVTRSASCGTWHPRTQPEPHTSSSTWAARRAGTPTASNTGSDNVKPLQVYHSTTGFILFSCCAFCYHFLIHPFKITPRKPKAERISCSWSFSGLTDLSNHFMVLYISLSTKNSGCALSVTFNSSKKKKENESSQWLQACDSLVHCFLL